MIRHGAGLRHHNLGRLELDQVMQFQACFLAARSFTIEHGIATELHLVLMQRLFGLGGLAGPS